MSQTTNPTEDTYFVIKHPSVAAFGLLVKTGEVLHLGHGCVIEWQGTDPREFAAAKKAAGIEEEQSPAE